MKFYVYARPDRDNWWPAVEKCQQQLLQELLKGSPMKQAEAAMFQRFQNVSNTYWSEFWRDVTAVPVERAYN
jgi:hypothetical protein